MFGIRRGVYLENENHKQRERIEELESLVKKLHQRNEAECSINQRRSYEIRDLLRENGDIKAKLQEATEKAEIYERQSTSYQEAYLDLGRNVTELKAQLEHSVPNGKIRLHGHRDPITVNELIGTYKQYRELSTELARKNAELEELLSEKDIENKGLTEKVERQEASYNQLDKQTSKEIEELNLKIAQTVVKDCVHITGYARPVSVTTLIKMYEVSSSVYNELYSTKLNLENQLKDVKENRARSIYELNEQIKRYKELLSEKEEEKQKLSTAYNFLLEDLRSNIAVPRLQEALRKALREARDERYNAKTLSKKLEEKEKENTDLKQFNEAVCNQNTSMQQYIKETTGTHWFSVINFFK